MPQPLAGPHTPITRCHVLPMQVIGEAAFGVKFAVQDKDAAGHITEGPIVAAAKYVLENTAAGEPSRHFLAR